MPTTSNPRGVPQAYPCTPHDLVGIDPAVRSGGHKLGTHLGLFGYSAEAASYKDDGMERRDMEHSQLMGHESIGSAHGITKEACLDN